MGKRGPKPATKEELIVRFWSKVNKNGPIMKPGLGPCWPWTGSSNPKGYGGFRYGGCLVMAHRFAFTITKGPLRKGKRACHKCDYPPCVRPYVPRKVSVRNLAARFNVTSSQIWHVVTGRQRMVPVG